MLKIKINKKAKNPNSTKTSSFQVVFNLTHSSSVSSFYKIPISSDDFSPLSLSSIFSPSSCSLSLSLLFRRFLLRYISLLPSSSSLKFLSWRILQIEVTFLHSQSCFIDVRSVVLLFSSFSFLSLGVLVKFESKLLCVVLIFLKNLLWILNFLGSGFRLGLFGQTSSLAFHPKLVSVFFQKSF